MLLDELKQGLQRHFVDGLAVIVGSGLSCAEGLPGMKDLTEHLRAALPGEIRPEDQRAWAEIEERLEELGLEGALTAFPPSPGLETVIVSVTANLVQECERRAITEVFSGARTLRFTRLLPHLLMPPGGLPVVTTNYDRLVEIAAEEAGLGVDTLFVGSFSGRLDEKESRLSFCRDVTIRAKAAAFSFRPRVNVFKPHGSLDWYARDGVPLRHHGDLPLNRLIITPGINKFRNGYESPFDKHRERANSAIDRASRFLILGYGFNDDHLETHLRPRIRGGAPALLLAHTLTDNARKLALHYPNVTAIERLSTGGSRVYVRGTSHEYDGIEIWDLQSFVSEVLEP